MIPNNHGGAISDNGDDGGASGSMLKKGPWTAAEDAILMEYVKKHGEGNWNAVQRNSGLSRCGKSCRLRWANHLRPNLKKGSFSPDEERFILELHAKLGNKWARMAAQLPGRTDNEIKNYWNTRVKRRQRAGLPLYPQEIQKQTTGFHLHHQRHLCPPSPPPPTHHPNPNFGSSLSLFDAINFSAATPIRGQYMAPPFPSPIHNRFKRFRDHNSVGLSLPLSAPPPPLPSSLLTQTLPSHFPSQPSLPFNSGNFDFNPPYMSTPFEPEGALPLGSVFSKKLELPSSQISEPAPFHAATSAFTNDYEISHPLSRSNSGLLDALLQEAQSMAGNENSKREGPLTTEEENPTLDGFVDNSMPSAIFSERCTTPPLRSGSLWDDSISVHSFVGAKRKRESLDEINSVDDEFSGLLDIIPSTASVSEWYSDSGEMSNGQSSAVTDDDIGLHVHQLAPSLSAVTTSDHDWILDSCSWDNMPGIC